MVSRCFCTKINKVKNSCFQVDNDEVDDIDDVDDVLAVE
jgi:hypothetical protein